MNPAELLLATQADDLSLALATDGTIRARGPAEALAQWTPAIREAKAALVELLTPRHRWLIHLPDGWRVSHFIPPASRAEVAGWYPGALALVPADDAAEPGQADTEADPGAAFYRRLFQGMATDRRCYATLDLAETHAAVVAGLIAPAATRGAVLLAYRDLAGRCCLLAIPKDAWDPWAVLGIVDGLEVVTLH